MSFKTANAFSGKSVKKATVDNTKSSEKIGLQTVDEALDEYCYKSLTNLPGETESEKIKKACRGVQQIPSCYSQEGRPIFHKEFIGTSKTGQRILVFAVTHGDEAESGVVAASWMKRLANLDSRNSWRVVPLLNPDGLKRGTRMNANGVDINRNFPTEDFHAKALNRWETVEKKDPRRYPGKFPASESETRCAIDHIKSYSPSFIVSVHTPYGVLDFDGPNVVFPTIPGLPWKSLGHMPGSLGRFMWRDHKTPVLTVELKGMEDLEKIDRLERIQDASGTVAIRSSKKQPDRKKLSWPPDLPKSDASDTSIQPNN